MSKGPFQARHVDDDTGGPKYPPFYPMAPFNVEEIPKVKRLYSDIYVRGYTSLTVAAPKVGKSLMAMAEAIDMASGKGLLTGREQPPLRVLYLNAEDDPDTLKRRIAAILTHYQLAPQDLGDRLILQSGMDFPDFVLMSPAPDGRSVAINETAFRHLEATVRLHKTDVVMLDPLQDLSAADETNETFRLLGRRLRRFGSEQDIALGLTHHTRKVSANGATPSLDDTRGGGALRGVCRFNRLLLPMSETEATKFGIVEHRKYFRIGEVEANLMPPSSALNRWFEKVSVDIANGESVGALARWTPPDAFSGVSREMASEVQRVARTANPALRESHQSPDWIGWTVMKVCGFEPPAGASDSTTKAARGRAQSVVKTWIENGVLKVVEEKGPNYQMRKVVRAGNNNPLEALDA